MLKIISSSDMEKIFKYEVEIFVSAESEEQAYDRLDKMLYYGSKHANEFSSIKTYNVPERGTEVELEEEEDD